MAVFNTFTFDGENSLDYGVYITGEAVYNAPERAVEMVSIPGKNGALALDQGRFENIEVTYPAGTFGVEQAEFAGRMRAMRNMLASRYNYVRLIDSYHPDEYRLGLYKSGLEATPVAMSSAGEFDLTFNCKPQRFLTSGEEPVDFLPGGGVIDKHTVTGEVVTFEGDSATVITEVEADIEPVQDLHGYDKPWAGGNGKNLLAYPYRTSQGTYAGIQITVNDDGSVVLNGTTTSNLEWSFSSRTFGPTFLGAGEYILTGCPKGYESFNLRIGYNRGNNGATLGNDYGDGVTITQTDTNVLGYGAWIACNSGATFNNLVIKPMIRLASVSDPTWEPYSNICPISGWDEAKVYVSPTTSEQDATVYTIDLDGTRYGGTLDVTSGMLTVDMVEVDLGTLEWGYIPSFQIFAGIGITDSLPITYHGVENIVCDRYMKYYAEQVYVDNFPDKSIALNIYRMSPSNPRVVLKDTAYTDGATLKSALSGAQFVYPLATPITVQLTPTEVSALIGTNYMWTDTGNITVTYGTSTNYVENPTEFDALPLLKVTGAGQFSVGEYIITITGDASQVIYIDCETMEIYKNTGGIITPAGDLVSFATNEFPKLPSGVSSVSLGDGITEVEITPRWWII